MSSTAWLALTLLGVVALTAAAAERGITVFRDPEGEQVGLYQDSHALLIGVSDYTGGWPDLENIPRELDTVQATLEAQGFHVARGRDPSSRVMKRTIEEFISRYGRNRDNRLLFFFAGHGHTLEKGYRREMGYLVPADAPHPDRDRNGFLDKAVSMNQVLTWAREIDAKHALFLFDSCFSGAVFKARNLPGQPPHISRLTNEPVRMFITAGSAGETVPAVSVFSPAFVNGLRHRLADLDKDGFITGTELGVYLQGKVAQHVDQTPQFGKIRDFELSQGDFVFMMDAAATTTSAQSTAPARPMSPETPPNRPAPGDSAAAPAAPSHMPVPGAPATSRTWIESTTGMEFVWVPEGCFQMGSPGNEKGRWRNEGRREVCLEGFWMGKHEVTNAQYRRLRSGHDSGSYVGLGLNGDDQPAVNVTWNDAVAYAKGLSKKSGHSLRLPTEAEWEYAARGGQETARYWGEDPHDACRYANGLDQSWKRENRYASGAPHSCDDGHLVTAPVGQFERNSFGLHDMLGNAWEWTCSAYANDAEATACPDNARLRVYRGGSWENGPRYLRAAKRERFPATTRKYVLGFRLLRSP